MKKIMLIAVAMLMSIATFAKDIKTVVLTTDPIMHCESCENKVKENLKYVSGIKEIVPCAETQSITVTYDADKTSVEKMQASLKKAGYTATVKQNCDKKCEGKKQCCGKCKEGAAEKKCCKQDAGAEKKCDGKCKEGAEKKCDNKCKEGADKKCDNKCKEGAEKKCDGKCKEGADKKCKEGAEKKGDCCKK